MITLATVDIPYTNYVLNIPDSWFVSPQETATQIQEGISNAVPESLGMVGSLIDFILIIARSLFFFIKNPMLLFFMTVTMIGIFALQQKTTIGFVQAVLDGFKGATMFWLGVAHLIIDSLLAFFSFLRRLSPI